MTEQPWTPPARPHRTGLKHAGLRVAVLQGSLLLVLGGQLLLDRLLQPRGWARSAPVDPELPIRGRYVTLQLQVPAARLSSASTRVGLQVVNGRLQAVAAEAAGRVGEAQPAQLRPGPQGMEAVLQRPLAFFLPPDVADPSQRPADDPLWVEVTLPRQGPPRPLQLGVERQGRLEPLRLR